MKTLKLFVCKRYFALLCCLYINIFSAFAVYTLKLGEPLVLTVDCPVSNGWLTSTGWDCPQYVQTQPNGVGVCTVYPFYYYSGTVTVTCNYWYSYPIEYNGRIRYQNGSGTKYFSIKIVKPTFTIDKTEITVQPGERFVLCTSMSNVYTPKYTTVYWTTSDNSTVKEIGASGDRSYGNQNYEFTAVSLGTATITATIGSGTEVTCKVTVANPDPDRVSLSKTGKIKVGEHITLTPTLYPSDSKATYTWSSDKNSVATVSNDGVVTGKKTGTARITVTTHNGKTDYCDITVDKGDLTIKVDKESGLYAKGTNVLLSANFSDADIYYTLDGSTPTENSTRYTGPIALNENLTLKAIAMGSEYNPSSLVTRTYQVTSLYRTDSWTDMGFYDPYFIPNVNYCSSVKIGKNFDQISFKNNNSEAIPGQAIIQDGTVYYVPDGTLKEGLYKLTVPQGAIADENNNPNLPVQLDYEKRDFIKFVKVVHGSEHTLLIDSDGTLWACGHNDYGQLGDGTWTDRTTPVKIMEDVAIVAAGSSHSLIIKKDGTLWACGRNDDGQLGDGTTSRKYTPVKIMEDVAAAAAGSSHSLIIKKDGTLWACGDNYDGQLGDGTTTSRTLPVKIMNGVAIVAAKSDHSHIVKKDGTLWAFGSNGYGVLGDGTTTSRTTPVKILSAVATVAVGRYHSIIMKQDGTMWTCGGNDYGQLGDGTKTYRTTPVKIIDGVSTVAAGAWHSLIVKKDGTLWACGGNYNGQLGDGTTTDRTTLVRIVDGVADIGAGWDFSYVIKSDGTLWAFGNNRYGQFGNGTKKQVLPVKVMNNVVSTGASYRSNYYLKNDGSLWKCALTHQRVIDDVLNFSAGGSHVLIVKKDGTLWACGDNDYGQLGDGTTTDRTTPVKIMDGVASAAAGSYHSLIIKKDGTLWACGRNNYGQLGDGITKNSTTPIKIMENVVSVAAGTFHSLIIKKDGTLWACGHNYYGQLGDGTTTNKTMPVKIMDGVAKLSANNDHSLIVKKDGTLWACGYNGSGQLGDGSRKNQTTPVKILEEVVDVAAGGNHSLIVKKDESLWACGHNSYNQLGDGTTTAQTTPVKIMDGVATVAAGSWHSLIVKKDGTLLACGDHNYGLTCDPSALSAKPIQIKKSSFSDVSEVSLINTVVELSIGDKYLIIPQLSPSNACCKSMTFNSSNSDVAIVSSHGIVEAIGNGRANITVIVDGTYKAVLELTVADKYDIDQNGSVDVADMVLTINHVLGKRLQDDIMAEKMDMNGDGQVDVGDVILIIKAILAQGGQIEVPVEARGKAETVDITKYTAMQLNVTVPTGTQIAEIQIAGSNSDTHQLMYLKTGDNSYTVVIYSLDNQTFSRVESSLLKVRLDGDGEAVMSNVLLATPAGERTFVGSMPMGTATGIKTVGGDVVNGNAVYDLRGNKMSDKGHLPKGVYIMNGKKVIK